MGPADSDRISRVPPYSGYCYASETIRIRDYHPLRLFFPEYSTSIHSCNVAVLQPRRCRNINGLGCCAFARHYWRNHYCFLFLQVMRCFSSLRSLPCERDIPNCSGWVAPFGNPGVVWLFAPNPGLSQLITSFFASKSQGIHRLPLFACFTLFSWKLRVESWKLVFLTLNS